MTEALDQPSEAAIPPPRVGRLTSSRGVRRELARLYADARQGRLDVKNGAKLAYMLTCLHKVIEIEEVLRRIQALEDRQR